MRIKALTKYNFSAMRNAVIIFCLCFIGATLLASVLNVIASNDSTVVWFGITGNVDGAQQTWSSGLAAISIFMLVLSLNGSQKDTRFLITRSVSRREIFTAYAVLLCPLAAIMSAIQIVSIYLDAIVRQLFGSNWRGLALDIQIMQAPDMGNVLVFFSVSFSILLAVGAISYLIGSLIARWKYQTLIVVSVLLILFLALIGSTDLLLKLVDFFCFMFLDDTTGLLIALKQIIFAALAMAISFPVMRKITAAKQ